VARTRLQHVILCRTSGSFAPVQKPEVTEVDLVST
jgi:hypothetical protein